MHRLRRMLLGMMPALLLAAHAAFGQDAKVLHYRGTIGEQRVGFTLEVQDGSVMGARYEYERQKGEIPLTESRVFGTTVVMADEDGNLFHLHLKHPNGETATSFDSAEALTGTMERGELDLLVKLSRVEPAKGR